MWKAVQRFEENRDGRDFAIGDIHGSYDIVFRAMDKARFDPARDRLFSVGDLIDRGSASERAAEFLELPFVHACKGNHESMLLGIYRHGEPSERELVYKVSQNNQQWWLNVTPEQQQRLLAALSALPIVMEVQTARGPVGLVHADIPPRMDWATFVASVEADNPSTLLTALWGRDRIDAESHAGVKGIGRVFVGHTPRYGGLRRYGNVIAIDTGAVYAELGYQRDTRLTMVNLLCKTRVIDEKTEPTLIDIRDTPSTSTRPFEQYAASL